MLPFTLSPTRPCPNAQTPKGRRPDHDRERRLWRESCRRGRHFHCQSPYEASETEDSAYTRSSWAVWEESQMFHVKPGAVWQDCPFGGTRLRAGFGEGAGNVCAYGSMGVAVWHRSFSASVEAPLPVSLPNSHTPKPTYSHTHIRPHSQIKTQAIEHAYFLRGGHVRPIRAGCLRRLGISVRS